jgi:uncharacterized protein with HEPN domain
LSEKQVKLQEANAYNLSLVLEFRVTRANKGRQYKTVRDTLKMIDRGEKLKELRNKSIVAHGYQGISPEDVEVTAEMTVAALLDTLRSALTSLGVVTTDDKDPYRGVQVLLQGLVAS